MFIHCKYNTSYYITAISYLTIGKSYYQQIAKRILKSLFHKAYSLRDSSILNISEKSLIRKASLTAYFPVAGTRCNPCLIKMLTFVFNNMPPKEGW